VVQLPVRVRHESCPHLAEFRRQRRMGRRSQTDAISDVEAAGPFRGQTGRPPAA
jgi:hypothetical protein